MSYYNNLEHYQSDWKDWALERVMDNNKSMSLPLDEETWSHNMFCWSNLYSNTSMVLTFGWWRNAALELTKFYYPYNSCFFDSSTKIEKIRDSNFTMGWIKLDYSFVDYSFVLWLDWTLDLISCNFFSKLFFLLTLSNFGSKEAESWSSWACNNLDCFLT